MDHTPLRISNFIVHRPQVKQIIYGDFEKEYKRDPSKFKKDFWAVNCSLDIFPVPWLVENAEYNSLYKNCAFLVSDRSMADRYRHLNFRYFPYFIAEGISQVKKPHPYENPEINFDSRKNTLSCVNRFARFHRLYTYYKICQYANLSSTRISFTFLETNKPPKNGILEPEPLSLEEMIEVARQWNFHTPEFDSWLRKQFSYLPIRIEEYEPNTKNDCWLKSEAFSECYANIDTETYVIDFLPTEKTVKPLLAGCLFLPTASQHFMSKLETMGFDLKFQGIDYNVYDNEENWIKRIDKVIHLADKIYVSIPDIWQQNIQRLKHNRELFFTKALEDHVLQDVQDIFQINY